jgi:hypothetical protein
MTPCSVEREGIAMADIARRSLDKFTYAPIRPSPAEDPRLTPASLKPSFSGALEWARVNDPNRADALAAAARDLVGHRADISPYTSAIEWDRFTDAVIATLDDTGDWTQQLTDGFNERMKVEPGARPGAWGGDRQPAQHHLLSAFDLIYDDTPFNGEFQLAQLLDVLGIDVSLKDAEALALKELTSFSKALAKQ